MFPAWYGFWQIKKLRTQSDKVLRDKAFKFASDPKYDGYQGGLASTVYKFFEEKSSVSGVEAEPNYQLANTLYKHIIKKFRRRKIYSCFRNNIWDIDLADMQSLRKYNKGIKYLLRAIDLFSKYAWVVNTFQKIISKGRKPNKYGLIREVNFTISFLKDFWK